MERQMSSFSFSRSSTENMLGVHSDLITIFTEAIKNSPIDFGVPSSGGLRTEEQQRILFMDGKSRCDGHENKSYHQTGNALDFYAYVNGRASWDKVHLAIIAGVILGTAKRLRKEGKVESVIKWGGTFGSAKYHGWDMPHFEIS